MSEMPALHIRDVPSDVVATLKERARSSGRSLNAELVATLEERAARERKVTLTRRLAEIADRVRISHLMRRSRKI